MIKFLEYIVEEQVKDKTSSKVAGMYIRTNAIDNSAVRQSIYKQTEKLEEFCKENNIDNIIKYVDIRKSGLSKERPALQKLIEDIKTKKVNAILVTDATKLFRNSIELGNLLLKDYMRNVEIISLDDSVEDFKDLIEFLSNSKIEEEIEETEEI